MNTMTKFRVALPLFIIGLAACTSKPPRQAPLATAPPPVELAQPAPDAAPPEPAETAPVEPTPPPAKPQAPAAPPVSPAVLALIEEAESSGASGQLDNAAASLERAIRIQPRNALLWQKLAELRLRQFQPGLAEDLAKKSNVLAKGDAALTRKNWGIIAEARRKKGDIEGAADADAKAGR